MELIRKLDEKERIKIRSGACENFAATFRLHSRIDLFEREEDVKQAIQTWKQFHKLLRAKIVELDGEEELFFALNESSPANVNLENVHFIRIKSEKHVENKVIYNLVLEKCFVEAINVKSELLWRMIFLEVEECVYEAIMQFHHIICDGISANKNFILLLEILEKTLKSEKMDVKEVGVYPGTIELFDQEIKSIKKRLEIPRITRPNFIDPDRAKRTSFGHNFPNIDGINFDLIEANSGKLFAKSDELFHLSKSISNMKVKRFIISQDVTTKLIKKVGLFE